MAEFVLVLYDDPAAFKDVSPAQMQSVIEEYTAWVEQIAEKGLHVGGHKLKDEGGRHLLRRDDGGVTVKDGPYSETKEVIGGIIQIRAESYDHAVEIARTCPHVRYGPKIELREIDPLTEAS